MTRPSRRVLGLFSLVGLLLVLLQLDEGKAVNAITWAAFSLILLYGLWKHKDGTLVDE